MRVAINGFGRIGRQVFQGLLERGIEVVGVNDITDAGTLAHLLKYDSNYGRFPGTVEVEGNALRVNGKKLLVSAEPDPARLPWKQWGVDLVVEATGRFRDRASAEKHLEAGARWVVLTAPAKEPDITVVLGANDDQLNPTRQRIISNASCTTNCLALVVRVLHERFGIAEALMNTVHAYTNDQRLLDLPHRDLRRARAAALSIIPTTTGAARSIAEIFPELKGKIDGMAFRVPVSTVSALDLVAHLRKPASVDDLREAFKEYAEGPLAGLLAVSEEPLVSVDFKKDPHSAIVDVPSLMSVGSLARVVAWYDNEWGYSMRVADLVARIAEHA